LGVDVDVVDLPARLALVLVVYLHDLDLLLPVLEELELVLLHEILADSERTHLLGRFHADDHVVEYEVGLGLDGLEGFEDVAVLFSIEVEGMLWIELGLQLFD
jgi:hypothetical protein